MINSSEMIKARVSRQAYIYASNLVTQVRDGHMTIEEAREVLAGRIADNSKTIKAVGVSDARQR